MGRLILLRHGESVWNAERRFTGWVDVPLSARGLEQARRAGLSLREQRLDVAFVSSLLRAQHTLYEVLRVHPDGRAYRRVHEPGSWYERFHTCPEDRRMLEIHVSEALNERFYGELQGRNKDAVRREVGARQVHRWRRSYGIAPPGGESLAMTAARVVPYFTAHIAARLRAGQTALVCAHGNSLRALIMHLEKLDPEQIEKREIRTGVPLLYTLGASLEVLDVTEAAPAPDG